MNLPAIIDGEVLPSPADGDWAGRIISAWQASIAGILEAGRLLAEAKAVLPHGAFEAMIEADLPFSPSTARRLMIVAEDARIRAHAHVLPPSWMTLYELTKLDDEVFERRVADGTIRPDMDRKAAIRGIGTRSDTKEARGDNFYRTPAEAVYALLELEEFDPVIWEPACGDGAISALLEAAGYRVHLSDLCARGCTDMTGKAAKVLDFLASNRRWPRRAKGQGIDIVTNPPFGEVLNAFVAHALRVHRPRKMALLLNLNFLCGFDDPDRCYAMDTCPPARVHVFKRRLPMMHRDGWEGETASSQMNTAWFVWEQNPDGDYGGPTVLNRVDWKDFVPAELGETS